MNKSITWRDVLQHRTFASVTEKSLRKMAKDLGYPFYLWGGQVHKTLTAENTRVLVFDIKGN